MTEDDFDIFIRKNEDYDFYVQRIIQLTREKDFIKKKPKPRLENDFKAMMELSGQIGGYRRLRRQLIISELTRIFLIPVGAEVSAWSIEKIQREVFGRSVSHNELSRYSDDRRGPADRVGNLEPSEANIKTALKIWEKYRKTKKDM
ncbi:hypothetical protein [Gluconobacter japonicus]|uniref:hypothetical protein n=1 Tax=Gluconobacter japonicus TaxID=376620 RepID=UPI001B8D8CB6|nr:hypothetical protein [Gluconobacter japonicus]MBS1051136.1 hypothetical protein [Gluconobacter japonicus]